MNKKLQAHTAIFAANTIFGLGVPVTKLLLDEWVTPMGYMASRSLGAAIVFWLIALWQTKVLKQPAEKVSRRDLLTILGGGLLGFVISQTLTAEALNYTSPVYFSLIATLTPVATMLTAALLIGERITPLKFVGVLIGIVGALLMVLMSQTLGSGSNDLLGIGLAVLSVLTWAVYLIITRHVAARYSPVTQMKYVFLISAVVTVPIALPELDQNALFTAAVGWDGVVEMLFIVLGATALGYFLIPFAMRYLQATTVSIYTNLQPVVASLVAIAIGQDVLTWDKPVAGLLVLTSAYIVTVVATKETAAQDLKKAATLLALLVVSTLPLRLHGQTLQASLSHYSTENGLKSDAIAQIIQDDYGYIWLATWNGLSRFDGYHFYNYQTGNISHIPHLHNRIMDMAVDHSQNIWLHMYDGRIFVLDRKKDMIVNPFKGVGNSEEYRTSIPIFCTSSGDMLAEIDDVGIYQMRMDQGKVNAQLITTAGLKVTCMAEGYHDDIWVGTDKGVHRIDMGNLSLERKSMFEDEHISCLFSNGFNIFVGTMTGRILLFAYGQEPKVLRQATGKEILSVFVDSQGFVWFADPSAGAYKLNPETGQERHYEQKVLVPEHDGRGGVFRENNGTVWVRMNQGGYGYYNRETDEVEYFHNDPINPWNLSNTVNASLELEEGVIFESTSRRALEKLEILKNTITRTLLLPNAESTIDNEIRAMHYDTKRKLLLMGNKNNTLFVIKPDGSRTTITTDSKGNLLGRIYGISQDSKNNYWLSSKDYGLFRMTPREGGGYDIVNFRRDPDDKWSLSSDAAYATVEDSQGNIWIATYGGGVNVLMKNKEGKYVMKNRNNEMRSYPHNSYLKVRTITTDKNGKVWAGTTDGILVFTVKDKKIQIDKLAESKEYPNSILMSNDIVYLARDKQGNMWVGTHGGGLSHTTGQDSKGVWLFETFDSQAGLPSEEIKSITFDKSGNVWFATDHVICSYNTQKKIFTTFSSLDGVDETMCSEGAALTLPNGNILIGTLNGYYTIDRKKLITNNGALMKLRITDFFLNDELQSPRLNNTFNYYVPDAKKVELPSHNNVFTLRFASLNYQLQHRVHYQYMLEGYEHEWLNANKSRTVSYSNIPTGTYHFKVKAFLLDSPDKYDMREIEIVVPPYFIFSKGAVWLYILLSIVGAIALMFWRQSYLARKYRPAPLVSPEGEAAASQRSNIVAHASQRGTPEVAISNIVAHASQRGSTSPPSSPHTEEKTDAYEIIDD